MPKKPLTISYVIFYMLLWPDTWQLLVGLLAAWLLTPRIAPPQAGTAMLSVLYVMMAAIGYAGSGILIRPLFRRLHKKMLSLKGHSFK